MFESTQTPPPQGQPNPPTPLGRVDDMFAATDSLRRGSRPSPFVPKSSEPLLQVPRQPAPPVIQEINEVPAGGKGKGILLFVLIVVVVGVAVGAGAFFLTKRSNKNPSFDLNQPVNEGSSLNAVPTNSEAGTSADTKNTGETLPAVNSNAPSTGEGTEAARSGFVNANVNIPPPPPVDRDQDGLTLDQEIQYGTSDSLADTDLDGLSDWQEVQVHHSNPLNPDTDGDGYIDGSEVKKGYSPTIAGE